MRFFPRRDGLWRFPLVICLSVVFAFFAGSCVRPRVWHITGTSMMPTIPDSGLFIVLSAGDVPSRGDLVIIRAQYTASTPNRWFKRVIAIPGDTIEMLEGTGIVRLNGEVLREPYLDDVSPRPLYELHQIWTLAPGEYFVMGDNRNVSLDSRIVGPIQVADILVVIEEWIVF
jgi:signal peptidase I